MRTLALQWAGLALFSAHALVAAAPAARAAVVLLDHPIHADSCSAAWEPKVKRTAEERIMAAIAESKGRRSDSGGYMEVGRVAELPQVYLALSYRQETMNQMLTRLSIYSEGDGPFPAGTVIPHWDDANPAVAETLLFDHELVKGWNMPGRAVREFFEKTLALCAAGDPAYCLSPLEQDLYENVYLPALSKEPDFYLIAYSVWSVGQANAVASHEILHAQYYFDATMRRVVNEFWRTRVAPADQATFREALRGIGYATDGNEALVIDEFQAYLLEPGSEKGRFADLVARYRSALTAALSDAGVTPVQIR